MKSSWKILLLTLFIFSGLMIRLYGLMETGREQLRKQVYMDMTFQENFDDWKEEGAIHLGQDGVYADFGRIGRRHANRLSDLGRKNMIEINPAGPDIIPSALRITNPYLYLPGPESKRGAILDRYGEPIVSTRWNKGRPLRKVVHPGAFGTLLGARPPMASWGLEGTFDKELNPGDHKTCSILTTIDANIQKVAFEALQGCAGAAIVMEVTSGDILALASDGRPAPGQRPVHRALERHYPPGSTFKPLVALAALETETVYADDSFVCKGAIRPQRGTYLLKDHEYGRPDFEGHNPKGTEDFFLSDAMAVSCNVTFAQVGLLTGREKLEAAFHQVRFDSSLEMIPKKVITGWTMPPGRFIVGSGKVDRGRLAQSAIGQRDVRVTPLHLATFYAALGNRGMMPKPRLVRAVVDDGGEPVEEYPPESLGQICSRSTAQFILEMLRKVMDEGTGKNLRSETLEIAGKTGTAQVPGAKPHSWFVGLGPARQPRWVVLVLVENGGYGSAAAGPAVMKIFDEIGRKWGDEFKAESSLTRSSGLVTIK